MEKIEKKRIYVYLIVAVLILVGYFFYMNYQEKQLADFEQETQITEFEDKMPAQCENGEWIEFPSYSKSGSFTEYKGNANLKSEASDKFTNQDGSIAFVTDENYSLTFFVERDVRIEGLEIGTENQQEIYVKRIKCVGKEANQEIKAQRQNLMKYVSENIDTLALEKSQGGGWQVGTFYFVNDNDVYVEYESLGSLGEETVYDARLWLIRVSKMEASVPVIETLAYIHEDENDPDKNVLKMGEDLYKDVENMTVYEFDVEKKFWALQ